MTKASNAQWLQTAVQCYLQVFPGEQSRLVSLIDQLARPHPPCDRQTLPGHVTASGVAIRAERMLLIRHPVIGKWIPPGGHVDAAENPACAALRETREETGHAARLHPWHARNPCPFDIDTHAIPPHPGRQEEAHLHHDFRYLLLVDAHSTASPEGMQVRWMPWLQIPEPGLHHLVGKLAGRADHLRR